MACVMSSPDLHSSLLARDVELEVSADGPLGRGERGGFVQVGKQREALVAVKVVDASETDERHLMELSSLPPAPEHTNVVKVIDRLRVNNSWFEVRALCEGGELFDQVAEEGALPWDTALPFFAQIVRAAAYCHACGVAHGQLRPEHVLLHKAGEVKLLGFVNSCLAGAGATVSLRPVRPLDAPEWHTDGGKASCAGTQLPAADVWSVCMMLIVMLHGSPPVACADVTRCPRYAAFVNTGSLSHLLGSEIASLLPEKLVPLLSRALHPEPSKRPTAATLDAAIAENLSCATWTTPPLSSATSIARPVPPAPVNSVANSRVSSCAASPAVSCAPARALPAAQPLDVARAAGWAGLDVPRHSRSSSKPLYTTDSPARPTGGGGVPIGIGGVVPLSSKALDAHLMPPPRQKPPSAAAIPTDAASLEGAPPPVRPSPGQAYVRSLGWQSLPQPTSVLTHAISSALSSLDVPYTTHAAEYRYVITPREDDFSAPLTPQSDSPNLAEYEQPSPTSRLGRVALEGHSAALGAAPGAPRPALVQPLTVHIQIYRACTRSAPPPPRTTPPSALARTPACHAGD